MAEKRIAKSRNTETSTDDSTSDTGEYTCIEDTACEEIEFYTSLIRNLKMGKITVDEIDTEKYKPVLSEDEIVDALNSIMQKTTPDSGTIEGYLDFYMSKNKEFDDPKYERLFGLGASPKEAKQPNPSRLLDYSCRNKLVGFLGKRGCWKWETEKIVGFIESLKNQGGNK